MAAGSTDPRDELARLNREIAAMSFQAGWDRPGASPLWAEPRTAFRPASWSYAEAKAALLRSSGGVPIEATERRNLVMVNPHDGNGYATVRTQVLAYQMVLPGERARTHRHSPHAGRIVLDANDETYTVVEGVKVPLRAGDVILTPSWQWHGHANEGAEPTYWIDFLDVPLVHLLEPMFFEVYPGEWQEPTSETRHTPLLFRWSETEAQLRDATTDPSGCFGRRVELGSPALPTVALYMERFDPGTITQPYRTTANVQYCVIEGSGRSWIDGAELSWDRGDVFVAPSWSVQRHTSTAGATLCSLTDEPLQRYCGYLRAGPVETELDRSLS